MVQPHAPSTRQSPPSLAGAGDTAMTATDAGDRVLALDLARSAALLAMAVYHFCFDLEMFGHLPPGTVVSGWFFIAARVIAGSFLVLAGISLALAHGRGVRWNKVLRRLGLVGGAAAAITAATYLTMPDRFVFFGILHAVTLFSLIGLLFLRLPAWATPVALAVVVWLWRTVRSPVFDAPGLLWVGLGTHFPFTVDYVPVFPWLAPFLAGLALARFAQARGFWQGLVAHGEPGPWLTALAWPGRHSLAVYLVHQPVLVALVWAGTQTLR